MNKIIDLTGQKFDYWTVLERAKNTKEGRAQWLCKCKCGQQKIVSGKVLRNGHSTSCGCRKREVISKLKTQDLSNQKFGKLTALSIDDSKKIEFGWNYSSHIWKCQCECGKIIYVPTNCLKNGGIKSCGCIRRYNNLEHDYTGETINNIKILKMNPLKKKWDCQCLECGLIFIKTTSELKDSLTLTCPHQKMSKGEAKIANMLTNAKIPFEFQKTFDNCRFPTTNALAKFDFYVANKYIIEFDGIQHFSFTNSGWNTEENFKKTQKYDIYKNNWCKENNIPIIRIPYTQLNQLSLSDLLLSSSYLIQ